MHFISFTMPASLVPSLYVCKHVCMYECMYVYMSVCMHARSKPANMHKHKTYIFMYVNYECMYISLYISICARI